MPRDKGSSQGRCQVTGPITRADIRRVQAPTVAEIGLSVCLVGFWLIGLLLVVLDLAGFTNL